MTLPICPLTSRLALLAANPYGNVNYSVDTTSLAIWIGLAVVVVGGLCGVGFFAHRAAQKYKLNSHIGLFHGLCKAHGLSRRERNLLGQVCRAQNLKFQGQVFTESAWLNPKKTPPALKDKREQLAKLYKKLFA
jgi:hypothetical protein